MSSKPPPSLTVAFLASHSTKPSLNSGIWWLAPFLPSWVPMQGSNASQQPIISPTTQQQDTACLSVKVFFATKFKKEAPIPVFQEDQWKKVRVKLRGKYREGNRASGKCMVEGKASSMHEDREGLATGSIWDGTAATAEFWHLLNSSYHLSRRGRKVSLVTVDGLTCVEQGKWMCLPVHHASNWPSVPKRWSIPKHPNLPVSRWTSGRFLFQFDIPGHYGQLLQSVCVPNVL